MTPPGPGGSCAASLPLGSGAGGGSNLPPPVRWAAAPLDGLVVSPPHRQRAPPPARPPAQGDGAGESRAGRAGRWRGDGSRRRTTRTRTRTRTRRSRAGRAGGLCSLGCPPSLTALTPPPRSPHLLQHPPPPPPAEGLALPPRPPPAPHMKYLLHGISSVPSEYEEGEGGKREKQPLPPPPRQCPFQMPAPPPGLQTRASPCCASLSPQG